jgi:hypothetical protein
MKVPTAENLLTAVKQLPPTELRKFERKFQAWRKQNGEQEEAALLASIKENSRLPDVEHKRYEQLRRKCERRTLTEKELAEYQSLLQKLEARNVKRVEALIALSKKRGTTLRGIMAELGLKGGDDAE